MLQFWLCYTLFTKRNAGSARLHLFWGRVYIDEHDIMYHCHSVLGKNLAKTWSTGKMAGLSLRFFWWRVYKKNGAVSDVESDFLSDWALNLARKVVVIPGYPHGLDWVTANINRNCNTFFDFYIWAQIAFMALTQYLLFRQSFLWLSMNRPIGLQLSGSVY